MAYSTFLFIVIFARSIFRISCQELDSPCPNIFQYHLDPISNEITGLIQTTGTGSSIMFLNVELSVGNPVRVSNLLT